MKNKIYYLLLISVILVLGSFKTNNTQYLVECNSLATSGYVDLIVWNPKKGKCYKFKKAQKDALHALLYSGIAGSKNCQTQKAILNTPKEIENFKKVETTFFSRKGDWKRFTVASQVDNPIVELNSNTKSKVYKVMVLKEDLRVYLEEKKIIDPLNKGF